MHRPVAQLVRDALPASSRDKIFGLGLIREIWRQAVGDDLARRSEPAAFDSGVLTVRVAEVDWGRTIVQLQRRVCRCVNREIGLPLVARLRFVRDGVPIPPLPRAEEPAAPSVLPASEPPPRLLQACGAIADPDLQQWIARVAGRYLAAQATRTR